MQLGERDVEEIKFTLGDVQASELEQASFRRLFQETVYLHEIELLPFLEQTRRSTTNFYYYVGCSKYGCFSCSTLLKELSWENRGSHCKAHHKCTVFELAGLSQALSRIPIEHDWRWKGLSSRSCGNLSLKVSSRPSRLRA